jgi:hypothetical protein
MAKLSERSKNQKSAAEDDDSASNDKNSDSEQEEEASGKDGDSNDSGHVEDDSEQEEEDYDDEPSFDGTDFFKQFIGSCKKRPAFDDSDKKDLKRLKSSYEDLRARKWNNGSLNLRHIGRITLGFTEFEKHVLSPPLLDLDTFF